MAHPTTEWALRYGLADPAEPARAVLDARPDQLRDLALSSRAVAAGASAGSRIVARAGAMLRAGWSTPAASLAVQSLESACRDVATESARAADALDTYAAAVDAGHVAVRRAYADADTTIAADGLLAPFGLVDGGPLARIRERRALVTRLYSTLAGVAGRLDDAAGRLVATIGPDPRRGLPSATTFGSAPPGPVVTADAANRAQLAADLTSPSPRRRLFARAVQRALTGAAADGAAVQLLTYDPTHPAGQGGAAIAVGDVAHADAVAVLVPGVGNSPTDPAGPLELAARLADATSAAAPGSTSATVVWFDYDVPLSRGHDTATAPGLDPVGALVDAALATNAVDAAVGGSRLADFTQRLRGMLDPSAGLTLIGHSYGSTVVSQAAADLGPDAGVNDIVLLGSPGAGYGTGTAADYSAVPADHVYALAFPLDPVAMPVIDLAAGTLDSFPAASGGPFGADPTSARFGAQVIDAPSSVPLRPAPPSPITGLLAPMVATPLARAGADPVALFTQHAMGNYLSGAALTAVAAVVAGRYAQVPVRAQR